MYDLLTMSHSELTALMPFGKPRKHWPKCDSIRQTVSHILPHKPYTPSLEPGGLQLTCHTLSQRGFAATQTRSSTNSI
ncbi:hypothetical protein PBY51_023480 [Eleginops maclovinus]|uniref:Uncharacterized protein n=1 Tax=Eleginops maclovinus TaxID=56733 RepID=A0AAN7X0H4_ELEMC|nr:hypothetical protein PBY51_023480 [Eleginops maclovinus]